MALLALTDEDPIDDGNLGWLHVPVHTPAGDLLDVRGAHTADDTWDT
jgi:hypothetical protein